VSGLSRPRPSPGEGRILNMIDNDQICFLHEQLRDAVARAFDEFGPDNLKIECAMRAFLWTLEELFSGFDDNVRNFYIKDLCNKLIYSDERLLN
jgi:hypothetical protein